MEENNGSTYITPNKRPVYIRPLNGSSTTIDTDMTATMLDLKKEYCRQAGVPVAEQTLIIGGYERKNDVRLCECNVDGNWNGVIHMRRTTLEQRVEDALQIREREIVQQLGLLSPEDKIVALARFQEVLQGVHQKPMDPPSRLQYK